MARLLLLLTGLWLGGFLRFALSLPDAAVSMPRTDAIVVLTGGKGRLTHGFARLGGLKSARLLISGVNPKTSAEMIQESHDIPERLLRCCADLGHAAGDTVGNADEAKQWMERHRYRSMLLVTSRSHMPRALLEFRTQMPDLRIIQDPVDADTGMVTLLAEYHKYLVRLLLLRTGLAK